MHARLPREMLAAVTRNLTVPVGTNVIVDALNYASAQLAGYYAWPWFMSEFTWTFRAPVTGTCDISDLGVVSFYTVSDPLWDQYVDRNWRIFINQHDYEVNTTDAPGGGVKVNASKTRPIEATNVNFRMVHTSLSMPSDFRPGTDFSCWNTTLRYPVRHVNRMAFQRHWQAYKQMTTNTSLIYSDREPMFNGTTYVHLIEFAPPPAANTQVRVAYRRNPAPINLSSNVPTEWPVGYDEVLELLATTRIGQQTGDMQAVNAGKRAQGLIRQLRGGVATAVVDDTPVQNNAFGGASWEQGGLSVLPREV